MNSIKITRTKALKLFRQKLGYSVVNLNTIIVGLNAVRSGNAKKPNTLSISWHPTDLERKEIQAREFAIRGLMVTACDALDHYICDITELVSPIDSEDIKSVLNSGLENEAPQANLNSNNIKSLAKSLETNINDPSKIKKELRGFSEHYFGTLKRISLRRRVELLYNYCDRIPKASTRPPMPHSSYYYAIELLIAWRNKLVHDLESDQLNTDALNQLANDAEFFEANHSKIDIHKTIENYQSSEVPTLKDVSTLVAILQKFIASIDAVLLADCNILKFFQAALTDGIQVNGFELNSFFKGHPFESRVRKAREMTGAYGFVPSTFKAKNNSFNGVYLQESDLNFLKDY